MNGLATSAGDSLDMVVQGHTIKIGWVLCTGLPIKSVLALARHAPIQAFTYQLLSTRHL